jgi:hypothetical protein
VAWNCFNGIMPTRHRSWAGRSLRSSDFEGSSLFDFLEGAVDSEDSVGLHTLQLQGAFGDAAKIQDRQPLRQSYFESPGIRRLSTSMMVSILISSCARGRADNGLVLPAGVQAGWFKPVFLGRTPGRGPCLDLHCHARLGILDPCVFLTELLLFVPGSHFGLGSCLICCLCSLSHTICGRA